MPVRVQEADFDVGAEIARLREGNPKVGAVASFVGVVRDLNEGDAVATLTLEHYPGMTESALKKIATEAQGRWSLGDVLVIHRYGRLAPGEQIMMVATASAHRKDAFEAAEYLMDYLKSRAPFWKKEQLDSKTRWVEQNTPLK